VFERQVGPSHDSSGVVVVLYGGSAVEIEYGFRAIRSRTRHRYPWRTSTCRARLHRDLAVTTCELENVDDALVAG